ncbi:MAG: hypothetical protein ABIR18_14605 [Chitinophagaceae bacterium]
MKKHITVFFSNHLKNYFLVLAFALCMSTAWGQSHRLLLRDEGLSQLSFVDPGNEKNNWYVPIPAGRDMQLVGRGRVLVGTGNGYEERLITTGEKVFELTSYTGTVAARRLRNGNTLLTGLNWLGKQGIVLLEVDSTGTIKTTTNFPAYPYVRLVRETTTGNFLVTADAEVFEGTAKGDIIWKVKLFGPEKPHAWQALRLSNGQTVISSGFAANFQVFGKDGKLVDSITGPANVHPHFYAGFQILKNGNMIVTNWQGHGPNFGKNGTQLLEYSPAGKLVWSWQQDATKYSSLQGVIVLDDLNLNLLHVEDSNGKLVPVKVAN